jgi:hypothetical protein
MFWSKIFRTKDQIVVAICDKELLGKRIVFAQLKVKISKYFYGGEIIDEKKAIYLMESCTIGNLIGEKIIKLAIERKLIAKENVILIGGIPHAQFI